MSGAASDRDRQGALRSWTGVPLQPEAGRLRNGRPVVYTESSLTVGGANGSAQLQLRGSQPVAPDRKRVQVTDASIAEELAEKLRRIATQLEEAGPLIEKLRRERYRKWNQPEAVVDVLELCFPKALDRDQIAEEMTRCGYEFRRQNRDPGRSVGATLSKLQDAGRVMKVSEETPGVYGAFATWTVPSR